MRQLFPRTFLSNIRLADNADEAGKSEMDLRPIGILPLDRLTAGKSAWLTRWPGQWINRLSFTMY